MALIEAQPEIAEVRLSLPNKLVDLSPFGQENENVVFHADDRPYGLIQATITRDDAPTPVSPSTEVFHRQTKIVATLGPATDAEGTIDALIAAGLDCARLNCSHGTAEELRRRAGVVRSRG